MLLCLILPAMFCLLIEKTNGIFWEEMLGDLLKMGAGTEWYGASVLGFAFCPQPLSRTRQEEGVPFKANSAFVQLN